MIATTMNTALAVPPEQRPLDDTRAARSGLPHTGGGALLEVALGAGQMGTWWWDRETGAGGWSEAQCRLLGYAPGEIEVGYETMLALVLPADRPRIERACIEVFERGEVELEFRIRRRDGEERCLLGRGRSVDGRVAVGVNVDITERKRAEESARARDATLSLALEAAGMGPWEADLDTGELRWTDTTYALFGMVRDGSVMTGERFEAMVLPEDRPAHQAAVARLEVDGEADSELRVRRPDGEVRWIHAYGRVVEVGGRRLALGVSYDITGRKQAELALRESETRLQLALAAGRMGVWDWHVDTDVVHWSDGMFDLLGLDARTTPSAARFLSLVLDEDRARVEAAVARALAAGDFAHEFRMRRGDGRVIWVAGRGAAMRDAGGRAVRLLGANFEITERKQAEAARDEASRRKDDFLAMLAHELRNPLAAIGAAAETLPRASTEPSVAAAAGIIGRQVRHLARLVDDLVDLARIQRGRVALRREPIDLLAALQRAIEQAEPGIASRGQSLALAAPLAPVVVVADPTRLAQVFANLLENATQYSAPGARIDLRVAPCAQGVDVIVEDSGAGIDPAVLPDVFEPFTQGPRSLDRSQGGLGLGLAVVKSLVELHGGSVRAESEGPGRGARFTVRLPVNEPRTAGPGDAPDPAPAPPPRPRRVLVVDDNADAAESLAMLLALDGHSVETALDGPSAIAVAKRFAPEVALLDIGLPGMDGYELAAALRADPELHGLRLVALTGYGQAEDRARSRAAGFDLHLVKPIAPEDLARCLDG